jgi:serine/threonine protein kinase
VSIIFKIKRPNNRTEPMKNDIKGIKEREEFAEYKKIKLLGEGSFGKAYLVIRQSDGL